MDFAQSLWLYFVLVFGIIVVPGMDMMFVLANALTLGRRAGLLATFGLMLGGAAHTVIGSVAVAGLSTLIPAIAKPMILIGSAYMIWVGISLVRSTIIVDAVGRAKERSDGAIVAQALLTAILNPKAWLFVMAVFPQFIRAENGPFWMQGLAIGVISVATQGVVYGGLALAAARGRDALTTNPKATIWIGRTAGWLLVAIAAYALITELVAVF
ncbi:MAG TPA: LysE family translocator [Rhizobiaceae bacterium]|nr:LysE family translocator [Rhizobiaceae bacterium]